MRRRSPIPRPTLATVGFVYFAEDEDQTRIKIGFTTNPRLRISWLNTCESRVACPGRRIFYVGLFKGTMADERNLQHYFLPEKIGKYSEWFTRSPRLLQYIEHQKLITLDEASPLRYPRMGRRK